MAGKPSEETKSGAGSPVAGLEPYDANFAPCQFGLRNTGVVCYFNNLLQSLAGCTSVTRAVFRNEAYMSMTETGKSVMSFVKAFSDEKGAKPRPDVDIEGHSWKILRALLADLRTRRPEFSLGRQRFGSGQCDSHEGLLHLLDMIEPVRNGHAHPITRLFRSSYKYTFICKGCRTKTELERDVSVQFSMPKPAPQTREEFERVIQHGAEIVEGRNCDVCKKKTMAHKLYQLRRASEVIVCLFPTAYEEHRPELYIPHYFVLPGTKGPLVYRKVAEAEHFGVRAAGHYQARGLRAGERVHILNDSSVFSSFFTSKKESRNVYLAFYHHCVTRPPEEREGNGEVAAGSLQDFIVPASDPSKLRLEDKVASKDVFDFSELYEGLN